MSETKKAEGLKKVRFIYHTPEDYTPIYVSGIYGGVTPRGELLCHFFIEHADVPAEEEFPVVEGKLQTDKGSRVERTKHAPEEAVLRRDIKIGLIIPLHHVGSIANWMLDKLKASQVIVEKEER